MADERKVDQSRRNLIKGAAAAAGASVLAGAPAFLRAQPTPIKIGQVTIASGRVAQIGVSSKNAILMEIDAFNKAGGLDGRMLALIDRDSKGKPDEAARFTRELINAEGCNIILDCEGSSGAFAVHEVVERYRRYGA